MQYIVDRIEKDVLILEADEGILYEIPHALIPQAKEGDCVEIHINQEETESRRKRIDKLVDELFT